MVASNKEYEKYLKEYGLREINLFDKRTFQYAYYPIPYDYIVYQNLFLFLISQMIK